MGLARRKVKHTLHLDSEANMAQYVSRPYLRYNRRFSADIIDAQLSSAATIAALLWSLAVGVLCSFSINDTTEVESLQQELGYEFVRVSTFEWWVFAGGAVTCSTEAFVLLLALWLQYSLMGLHIADEDDELVLLWLQEMGWFIRVLSLVQNIGFFSIVFVGAGLMQLHTRKANIRTFTGVVGAVVNLIGLPLFGVALYWHHNQVANRMSEIRGQRRATVLATLESKSEEAIVLAPGGVAAEEEGVAELEVTSSPSLK